MIAHNTNESIDNIMWNMSAIQAFKMVTLAYVANTGKDVQTHEEKAVMRKKQEKFAELANATT